MECNAKHVGDYQSLKVIDDVVLMVTVIIVRVPLMEMAEVETPVQH